MRLNRKNSMVYEVYYNKITNRKPFYLLNSISFKVRVVCETEHVFDNNGNCWFTTTYQHKFF